MLEKIIRSIYRKLEKMKCQIIEFISQPINWVCLIYGIFNYLLSNRAKILFDNGTWLNGIELLTMSICFWFCIYAYKIAKLVIFYLENKRFNIFDITFIPFICLMIYNIIQRPLLYVPSIILFILLLQTLKIKSHKVTTQK